jgi:glucan biosynthesis protein C
MTPAHERYHQMDALRALAMLLGVFLHAGMPYMQANAGGWPPDDSFRSVWFDIFIVWTHSFRMPLFFMMAGFFARLLYLRTGVREFIRRRAIRIGIPLAIGLATLVPLLIALRSAALQAAGLEYEYAFNGLIETVLFWIVARPTGHLWFLCYLIFFYIAMLAAIRLFDRPRWQSQMPFADLGFVRLFSSRTAPLWLAVPPGLLLIFTDCSIRNAPRGLHPEPGFLCYYGFFFLIGWFLHRNTDLLSRLTLRRTMLFSILSVFVLILMLAAFAASEAGASASHRSLGEILSSTLYALLASLMILAMLGGACHLFRCERPAIRYLADSAYWVYLIHLPLVRALQIVWRDGPVPGPLRYWATLAISLPLLYLSYHYLVRHTAIGAVLHGRRFRNGSAEIR